MESVENLIPDKKGNHVVVVLYFYDDNSKSKIFQIPSEFVDFEVADINIRKLELTKPVCHSTLFKLCRWLMDQLFIYKNTIFTYICSTEDLENNHDNMTPQEYRWNLFECLFNRYKRELQEQGINTKQFIVGSESYQSKARIFYRDSQSPIIHIVESHLREK